MLPVGLAVQIESPTENYDLAVQEILLNANTQATSSTGPGLFPDPLDPEFYSILLNNGKSVTKGLCGSPCSAPQRNGWYFSGVSQAYY